MFEYKIGRSELHLHRDHTVKVKHQHGQSEDHERHDSVLMVHTSRSEVCERSELGADRAQNGSARRPGQQSVPIAEGERQQPKRLRRQVVRTTQADQPHQEHVQGSFRQAAATATTTTTAAAKGR